MFKLLFWFARSARRVYFSLSMDQRGIDDAMYFLGITFFSSSREHRVNIEQLLANIEQSESGPQVAALFDFDGTIISGYSAMVFLKDQLTSGDLPASEFLELARALTSFGMGNMGFSAMMTVHAQFLAGRSADEYMKVSEQLFRKGIARLIYPESRRLIEAHRAKGHTIAIISSATPYQVRPAATDLDITHVYATDLEVKRGKFTGRVIKPTVFGEGKVDAAKNLAAKIGCDLSRSFFYSDSTDDIQLLEYVGKPTVLNARKRLVQIAEQRHWPAATFKSRGRPSVGRFARSLAATASLVPSFMAGVPISALTGSARDGVNFSMSLFSDAAAALIGLELDVKGRENLWKARPAMFMFNHQSKTDVVIMASLLRRDIAGIGKKEIKKLPLIGKVLEMAGVVMIDRNDPAGAIEAIKPLVTAMREEGKSVVMAPEGTRTPTRKLAAFKKGGFHIAMQAGVPIVPVVIHNAGDIAPKGDFVFRQGTVKVEILPPVETQDWTAANMDNQVAQVRALFLAALGQTEDKPSAVKAAKKTPRKTAKSQPAGPSEARKKVTAKKGTATKATATKASAAPANPAAAPKAKASARTKAVSAVKAKPGSEPTTNAAAQRKAKSAATETKAMPTRRVKARGKTQTDTPQTKATPAKTAKKSRVKAKPSGQTPTKAAATAGAQLAAKKTPIKPGAKPKLAKGN